MDEKKTNVPSDKPGEGKPWETGKQGGQGGQGDVGKKGGDMGEGQDKGQEQQKQP